VSNSPQQGICGVEASSRGCRVADDTVNDPPPLVRTNLDTGMTISPPPSFA
jgi:hypothetical protein